MTRMRIASPAVTAIFASFALASAAHAGRYDGNWTMVAQTTRGHCGIIYIGIGVDRGRIFSTGGSFAFYPINVGGRVNANGRTSMKAVAGPRIAYGTGRFSHARAEGTWRGRGPSGLCSGVWSASRAGT
jgi:hypothetical protein